MKLLRLGLLLACVAWAPVPVLAADDLAISQRADEALMWQRKSRDDLAADIWRRILVLDPNHALALLNLGLIEARAGHPAEARALLLRAQHLKKPPLGLARLEAALADQPDVPPVPELAEVPPEPRSAEAEPRRRESGRKRRAESASVAETDRAEPSSRRSSRTTARATTRPADEPASSRAVTLLPAAAPVTPAAPTAAAPFPQVTAASSASAARVDGMPRPATSGAGARNTAALSLDDDERSPAIPFPELASQLPMGTGTSGTTLARPAVVPLEATPTGVVVRGKPRPTKPLPFLPPPV